MNIYANDIEKNDIEYIHRNITNESRRLVGSRILLTGGGGFVGYYLIKSLIAFNKANAKRKIALTVCDNFKLGIPQWLLALAKQSDIHLVNTDVAKLSLSNEFNYIIHAASIASPKFYRIYPIETIHANINGLLNLLNSVIRNKTKALKGFLFFSSSEIYGNPDKKFIPTPETYPGIVSCTGPRACYDESKRFGETLCVNYAKEYSLPIKIVRPFNNYGPGLKFNDGRVIADFARNIIRNEDIVMYSDGSPKRTFCYIADAIIGYLKVLVLGKQAESYNIGVEKPEISIKNLALLMQQIGKRYFNYTGKATFNMHKDKNYLADNPQRRCPSIKKARKELQYRPKISLEDGLSRMLSWWHTTYINNEQL